MIDSDDDEEGGSDDDALRGMATSSGLRAMLAKARGESPANGGGGDNAGGGAGIDALDASSSVRNGTDGIHGANSVAAAGSGGEGIDRMIDAAKKTAEKLKSSPTTTKMEEKSGSPAASAAEAAIAVDKDGKRLITLEAVRREIWLNNGAITSKRLTKKFDVGKKNPERQALFKRIVMELCTIKKDADGNKLVLKQHYSKIS